MNAKIFTFMKPSSTSMVASQRIATFLERESGFPLVWDDKWAYKEKLDVLFIVNGAFAFCKYLPVLAEAVVRAGRVIWVQNDYTIVPPQPHNTAESPFRKAFRIRADKGLPDIEYWTTVKGKISPGHGAYVNWNCLTYAPKSEREISKLRDRKLLDVFYYGSYRVNRLQSFDTFFGNFGSGAGLYKVTISSPSEKFQAGYPMATHMGPIKTAFSEQLAVHGAGLYIEDKKSHTNFHSPANRFYEMLGAGLPMIFDVAAAPMMMKAGFVVTTYAAANPSAVKHLLRHADEIGMEQRRKWRGDYVQDLTDTVRKLIKAL